MGDLNFSSQPEKPSEIEKFREKLDKSFRDLAALISASRKPLPTESGDGTYLDNAEHDQSFLNKLKDSINDISHLGVSGVGTLIDVKDKEKNNKLWNDKEYLMENLIQLAASFPENSQTASTITNGFLTGLYNDLSHPPLSYLSDKYFYRSADGSFNSLVNPKLGKANTPYARSVRPKLMQPGSLPDPGDIFDSIIVRKRRVQHPNQISSVLFYLASIIIHDIFRTSRLDSSISTTSSYLDLAPLYGSNQEEQNRMRTFKDGKLKPDAFSEVRLLSFPPGVGILLVMFNRFHNDVVDKLAEINQDGRFNKPKVPITESSPSDLDHLVAWKKYDEELFQTGRLVTCGLYINIILQDYVRTILNLNKTNSKWRLDPRADIKNLPTAAGNQVSCEFNLIYRWHAAISARDEEWTNNFWAENFPGLDPATVTIQEFGMAAGRYEAKLQKLDPSERPLASFKRTNGVFNDDELVKELVASVDDPANSFGANRVPSVLRIVEILGIQQARAWNVASLNEFRAFFALEPHKTFESINSDPYVADQLRHLYDHPDYVELYPGLLAEEAKEPILPGSGLAAPFTVSRAVLSDAVALVRGDRFYTVDYDPKKLTNWGFTTQNFETAINHGCVTYKLFLNAFPFHFAPNSVYAHFPFTTSSEMKLVLKNLERQNDFSYEIPHRRSEMKVVNSFKAIQEILNNSEHFKSVPVEDFNKIYDLSVKELSPDDLNKSNQIFHQTFGSNEWNQTVRQYFERTTEKLLKEKAYKIGKKNQVDIIRDVSNLVHVHFLSDIFSLPLKSNENPQGIFTEHELYLITGAIQLLLHFDVDPVNTFPVRQKSKEAINQLSNLIKSNIEPHSGKHVISHLIEHLIPNHNDSVLKPYGESLVKSLFQEGFNVDQIVWRHILGSVGCLTANQGKLFTQVLDYYLNDGREYWPAIHEAAIQNTPESFSILRLYVKEGVRIAGEIAVDRQVTKDIDIIDDEKTVSLKTGDQVLLNLHAASVDINAIHNPDRVDLHRPDEAYVGLNLASQFVSGDVILTALTAMFNVIGKLNNLRPALGPQGILHKIHAPYVVDGEKPTGRWFHEYLTENQDQLWPFPQTLRVNWDD